MSHVRRLLDIVACTTNFGPSSPAKNPAKATTKPQAPPAKQSPKDAAAAAAEGDGEISQSCPKLESFYEFFSLSHLTAPLQCTAPFPLLPLSHSSLCNFISLNSEVKMDGCRCEEGFEAARGGDIGGGSSLLA